MNENFGQHVRSLREQRGLTQQEVADLLGVGNTYISKIENGKIDVLPSEELIRKMANVLGVAEYVLLRLSAKIDARKLQEAALGSPEIAALLLAIQEGEVSRVLALNVTDKINRRKGRKVGTL